MRKPPKNFSGLGRTPKPSHRSKKPQLEFPKAKNRKVKQKNLPDKKLFVYKSKHQKRFFGLKKTKKAAQ